jgi:hypothetical protein
MASLVRSGRFAAAVAKSQQHDIVGEGGLKPTLQFRSE